jgi:hypothetical protein
MRKTMTGGNRRMAASSNNDPVTTAARPNNLTAHVIWLTIAKAATEARRSAAPPTAARSPQPVTEKNFKSTPAVDRATPAAAMTAAVRAATLVPGSLRLLIPGRLFGGELADALHAVFGGDGVASYGYSSYWVGWVV